MKPYKDRIKRTYIMTKDEAPTYPEDDKLRPVEYDKEINKIVEGVVAGHFVKNRETFIQYQIDYETYLNECRLRCWRGLKNQFKGQAAVSSYVFRVCYNHFLNTIQSAKSNKNKIFLKSVSLSSGDAGGYYSGSDDDREDGGSGRSLEGNSVTETLEDTLEKSQETFRAMRKVGRHSYLHFQVAKLALRGCSIREIGRALSLTLKDVGAILNECVKIIEEDNNE